MKGKIMAKRIMKKLTRNDKGVISSITDNFKEWMEMEGYVDCSLDNFHRCTYQIKNDIDNGLYGIGDGYYAWVYSIGFFFGEMIINDFGGQWVNDGDYFNVKLNESTTMYPLNMANKFLQNGVEDDLLFKYQFAKNLVNINA
jgi:hypothetical protein